MLGKELQGRYKILKQLGQGGFGATFVAEDSLLPGKPQCVVKQLHPTDPSPSFVKVAQRLFATEAQILQKLGDHDQIPRLLAYFTDENHFFLVQELIEGQSLDREFINGEKKSEQWVIEALTDILGIVRYIHRNQAIHRDIKPSNLIRRKSDNRFVLIDFGAIKNITKDPDNMFQTVAIGTCGYAPAEQLSGRPTYSSDLYALGMIMVEALTGLHPSGIEISPNTGELEWHCHTSVRDQLIELIDKMIKPSVGDRYTSAEAILQALQTFSREEDELDEEDELEQYSHSSLLGPGSDYPPDPTTITVVGNTVISETGLTYPATDGMGNQDSVISTPAEVDARFSRMFSSLFSQVLGWSSSPEHTQDTDTTNQKRQLPGTLLAEHGQPFLVKFSEILLSGSEHPSIFNIYGIGGVGKTSILKHLKDEHQKNAIFVEVFFDLNLKIQSPIDFMKSLYQKLKEEIKPSFWKQEVFAKPDPFLSMYEEYFQTLNQLETLPIQGRGQVDEAQLKVVKNNF